MTGNHGYDDDQDDFPLDVRVPAPARRKRRRITGLVNGVLSMCVLMAVRCRRRYVFIKTSFEQAGPLEAEKASSSSAVRVAERLPNCWPVKARFQTTRFS